MKLRRSFFLVCTLATGILFQGRAQDDALTKRSRIEISGGLVYYGPAQRMKNLLIDEGFDTRSPGFIFGPVDYPVISQETGTTLSLGYSWEFKPRQRLGLEVNRASLREIAGKNDRGDFLEVGFSLYGIGISYSYFAKPWILKISPQLNFNRVYSLDMEDFSEVREKVSNTLSAGLKLAIETHLWNKKYTFSKLGFMYMASYGTTHGPFPFDNSNGSLEASKLNFGHGSVYLSFGVNL